MTVPLHLKGYDIQCNGQKYVPSSENFRKHSSSRATSNSVWSSSSVIYSRSSKPSFSNANFPTTPEGRTYHLGTKGGEVANRILSVGATQRAELLSKLLDPPPNGGQLFRYLSSRGFLTVTGEYQGTPISIVSTQMGMPNMDFVVRECRAVVEGPMAVVRLGTCGALQPPASLGQLIIAHSSINIRRNPDAWSDLSTASMLPAYMFTLPVQADPHIVRLLAEEASSTMGASNVISGLNATADSFYSSQGRVGGNFDDRNEGLIEEMCEKYPDMVSLEMETFHLLDMARCSGGRVRAAGMCLALADRKSNEMLEYARLEQLEVEAGLAALRALIKTDLD
ncbi:hypothetical protein CEUSTIGMA_g4626.t1 [Chlamydomonas eustigma]|uniref:Nucleoside phosphorylase domain-containing protein n=1 Tax=Chlamydomonas eustigma TaxID=1157962 RepID=A0A250X336_9CHLO|nr:hypothetical protein CEUSTIGMA_g4626.t1 [Chlamydomonas eustigma]|eukprot:GAX77180.1 hypothetical protein CEUSTIGMA_g4626.t1 [Chlamydomonas eustigma]